jgi:hypothetical protein
VLTDQGMPLLAVDERLSCVMSIAYGYIVDRFHSYDAPFVPMAALLFIGALLWFRVDASKEIRARMVAAVPVAAV